MPKPNVTIGVPVDERTALLPEGNTPASGPNLAQDEQWQKHNLGRRSFILITSLTIFLAVELGGSLATIPLLQIQEGIVCRQHHANVTEPAIDPRCKDSVVQADFAMLQGWESTFGLIPGLLLSVPYGIASDKHGRRVVLFLSLLGIALLQSAVTVISYFPAVFPIRLIWASAFLTVIGGGPFVMNAVICTICSDVSTSEQRSNTFFLIAATAIAGQLIGNPLTYVAMNYDVWFATFLGVGILYLATFASTAVPETLDTVETMERASLNEDTDPDCEHSSSMEKLTQRFKAATFELLNAFRLLATNARLCFLLGSFVFTTLGKTASAMLLQYVTKKFQWTWAEASLLLSVKATISLVLFVAVFPMVNQLLLNVAALPAIVKDMWLSRGSILCLVVGTFGLGLAPTSANMILALTVYSLGSGYGATIRSLLTATVSPNHTGMLYSLMSLLENTGALVAGPLLAVTFRIGMGWGGVWVGLPFIAAGFMFSIAMVVVFSIQPRRLTAAAA
ncbi:hypothetical protein NHJ13051_009616 [Beauveria bassiana]